MIQKHNYLWDRLMNSSYAFDRYISRHEKNKNIFTWTNQLMNQEIIRDVMIYSESASNDVNVRLQTTCSFIVIIVIWNGNSTQWTQRRYDQQIFRMTSKEHVSNSLFTSSFTVRFLSICTAIKVKFRFALNCNYIYWIFRQSGRFSNRCHPFSIDCAAFYVYIIQCAIATENMNLYNKKMLYTVHTQIFYLRKIVCTYCIFRGVRCM